MTFKEFKEIKKGDELYGKKRAAEFLAFDAFTTPFDAAVFASIMEGLGYLDNAEDLDELAFFLFNFVDDIESLAFGVIMTKEMKNVASLEVDDE